MSFSNHSKNVVDLTKEPVELVDLSGTEESIDGNDLTQLAIVGVVEEAENSDNDCVEVGSRSYGCLEPFTPPPRADEPRGLTSPGSLLEDSSILTESTLSSGCASSGQASSAKRKRCEKDVLGNNEGKKCVITSCPFIRNQQCVNATCLYHCTRSAKVCRVSTHIQTRALIDAPSAPSSSSYRPRASFSPPPTIEPRQVRRAVQ